MRFMGRCRRKKTGKSHKLREEKEAEVIQL